MILRILKSNKLHSQKNQGFTLIELLVVIAIIGLLSSIVLASLNSARAKARDARRSSDLNQIRIASEMYYDDNNSYPFPSGAGSGSYVYRLAPQLSPAYLPTVPEDPNRTGTERYRYWYTDLTRGYTLLVRYETDAVTGWCKIVGGSEGYSGWDGYPNCEL